MSKHGFQDRRKKLKYLKMCRGKPQKLVRQYKHLEYADGLKKLTLTIIEERRQRGDMILTYW